MDDDRPENGKPTWIELLQRLFSGRRRVVNEKELQEIIHESEEEGIINEGEGEMLNSIFEFGETIVREIMVPRTDMVGCDVEATLEELLEAVISSGHSRIPIYQDSPDRIVGIVYAKDLLRFWGKNASAVSISRVMRDPYFVPESKNIEELLQEFRTKRVHLAIAVDEYGGTSGLVTIEDLLEEIVGDIQDEYDLEEEWLLQEEDGSILVDARYSIEDLEEYFDLTIAREKFDTVGGYVIDLLGYVPAEGEVVVDSGLQMTAVERDERKISKIRIQRAAEEPKTENGD